MNAAPSVSNVSFELKGWRERTVERSVVSQGKLTLPGVQRVPVHRFLSGSSVVVSAKPIEVLISPGEEGIVAESDALHLIAAGRDVSEAVSELSEQLVYFFHYYNSLSENEVIGLAARLREIYRTQFQEQQYKIA